MIKILFLDDSLEKIGITRDFLIGECNIPIRNIDVAYNVKEGRKLLYENDYDLLLLDLVLPRDQESEATAEDCVKFLGEIYYNSEIHIPVHIIGFSQHDELFDLHGGSFEDKLWHLISFSYTDNRWKDKLKNKVCHLVSVKTRFKESLEMVNKFDMAIICALEMPELQAVLELQCGWKLFETGSDPLLFHEGRISTINGNTYRIIACSINKMGMQATASVASMIIARFQVQYIFMVGICAGVRERGLNFGDIIITENCTDYGNGKVVEDADSGNLIFKPEPQQLQTDQMLLAKLSSFASRQIELLKIQTGYKGVKPNEMLQVKIAPTLSGAYVVASKSMVESISEPNRKIAGIDMEGYGLYLTCHFFNQTKPLMIKSVCDFADEKKDDRFQAYASYTSAKFLHAFIFEML